MHEALILLIGMTVGTGTTCAGAVLGAYLVKRTYSEVTNPPHIEVPKPQGDNKQTESDARDAYDWDSYDQYIKGSDDDDGIPEA